MASKKRNRFEMDGRLAYVYFDGRKNYNKFAVIDIDDLDKIKNYKWYYKDGYAVTDIYTDGRHIHLRMHRLIMDLSGSHGEVIDHINGLENDNRKCNLRICTSNVENLRNRKINFYIPEIFEITRDIKTSMFVLKLSDGKYNDVIFKFKEFDFVLNIRKEFYEYGMEMELPEFIKDYTSKLELMLKGLTDKKDIHHCINLIKYYKYKLAEGEKVEKQMIELVNKLHEQGINVEKNRIYNVNGSCFIVGDGTSSKQRHISKDIPLSVYIRNCNI